MENNQYEEAPERICRICKQVGKGMITKYNDEGSITELFVCECGHQEVL